MPTWPTKRTSLVSLFDWNCLAMDAILIDLVCNIWILDMSFFNLSLDMLTFKTYILLETLIPTWTLSIFIEMPTLGVNLVLFRKDYGLFKTFLNMWSLIIFNWAITSLHSRLTFSKKIHWKSMFSTSLTSPTTSLLMSLFRMESPSIVHGKKHR